MDGKVTKDFLWGTADFLKSKNEEQAEGNGNMDAPLKVEGF